MTVLSSLDWMNLFGGMDSHQVVSVLVVVVIFTAAAGLALISLIAFGVRSGLMIPTARIPVGTDVELAAYLGGLVFGMISIFLMVFLGLAENDLDNPAFLPLAVGPILIGGVFFLSGAAIGFRTVRRNRTAAH